MRKSTENVFHASDKAFLLTSFYSTNRKKQQLLTNIFKNRIVNKESN